MSRRFTMRIRPLLITCHWVEFLDEEQCLLLDDGVSVGAVYAVESAPTEGRSAGRLLEIRDAVEDALQDSLDEHDDNPWVVQFFCQDEDDVSVTLATLRDYILPAARGTAFTEAPADRNGASFTGDCPSGRAV